jgi:hypothetical protein
MTTHNRPGSQRGPHTLWVLCVCMYVLTTEPGPIGDRALCRYVSNPPTTDTGPNGDRTVCRDLSDVLTADAAPVGDRTFCRY